MNNKLSFFLLLAASMATHAAGTAEYATGYETEAEVASEYVPGESVLAEFSQDNADSTEPEIQVDIIPDEPVEDDVEPPQYSFDQPTGSNAGACDTVLCLGGMVLGKSGGSACNGPIKDFFKILKFDKDGGFSPSKTSKARSGMLNGCVQAPGDIKSGIINKFGRVFGL